jgi:hypothetical protein
MDSIYVVLMQRFGNDESHHYVIGAYSTSEGAKFAADKEEEFRGGKYFAKILPLNIDAPVPVAWYGMD